MPSTLEDIKNEVLGHGFSSQNYSARIGNWLNEGIGYIYRTANLLEGLSSQLIETTADTGSYQLNSFFAKVQRVMNLDAEDVPLSPFKNYGQFLEFESSARGAPEFYIITYNSNTSKKEIRFRPIPEKLHYIEIYFQRIAPEVSNATEEVPLPSDYAWLLTEFCLYKAYLAEGDMELSDRHKAIFDSGLIRFTGDVENDRRDGAEVVEGTWET